MKILKIRIYFALMSPMMKKSRNLFIYVENPQKNKKIFEKD